MSEYLFPSFYEKRQFWRVFGRLSASFDDFGRYLGSSFAASFPIFRQYVGTSRSVFRTLFSASFTVFQAVFGASFGVSFTNLSGRSRQMSYRKVGALEQCWYIIRWKISQLFRRKKK
jgi:hypothetical protein